MKILNQQEMIEKLSHAVLPQQTLFVQGGAATPHRLISCMMEASENWVKNEIIHLHTEGDAPYRGHPVFQVKNLFLGKNMRAQLDYEKVDYIPCFLSEMGSLFRKGFRKVHVALIHVSPPDKHGHVSLGVSVDIAKAAVESADLVIAQINLQMPRVHGDGFLKINEIDFAMEINEPLSSVSAKNLSETELLIGKHVAELVEDRATLQLGIGAIPDAVCYHLKNHQNLGLHTEMWSLGAFDLMKKGVINNKYKKFHQGKSTSAFVIGNEELYKEIDDNLTVLNLEADYTNNPLTILRNPKVTAINSATEIDLTGQVCADSIGSRVISGVGGQVDFMRAAALSEGGKPILALSSLTKKGESRIQVSLKPGAGVVTTRSHIHYVVTEYGSANLFGKSIGERAKLLINLAHPKHREFLEKSWREIL
jgi:4-hydroxybutyrate CoA-transferase